MIIVEPREGLCNRMQALGSAISIAKDCNKTVHLIWGLDKGLNCPFDELFTIPKIVKNIFQIRFLDKKRIKIRKIYRSISLIGPGFAILNHWNVVDIKRIGYHHIFSSKRILFISTWNTFHPLIKYSEIFYPIEPLNKIINSYNIKGNTIGVHIRRTDNWRSIKFSPRSIFIDAMRKEIMKDNNTKFFLATDSPQEEVILKKRFSNRILTHKKKSLDRSDPQATKDALIDMYCLSKCKKIIGSYFSSFSRVASQINGVPLGIIKCDF